MAPTPGLREAPCLATQEVSGYAQSQHSELFCPPRHWVGRGPFPVLSSSFSPQSETSPPTPTLKSQYPWTHPLNHPWALPLHSPPHPHAEIPRLQLLAVSAPPTPMSNSGCVPISNSEASDPSGSFLKNWPRPPGPNPTTPLPPTCPGAPSPTAPGTGATAVRCFPRSSPRPAPAAGAS